MTVEISQRHNRLNIFAGSVVVYFFQMNKKVVQNVFLTFAEVNNDTTWAMEIIQVWLYSLNKGCYE